MEEEVVEEAAEEVVEEVVDSTMAEEGEMMEEEEATAE
jgi:hypothetical protein